MVYVSLRSRVSRPGFFLAFSLSNIDCGCAAAALTDYIVVCTAQMAHDTYLHETSYISIVSAMLLVLLVSEVHILISFRKAFITCPQKAMAALVCLDAWRNSLACFF